MKCLLAAWSVALVVTTAGVALGAQGPAEARKAPTAQALAQRYGYGVNLKLYPQGNPQEAIRSIAKAAAAGDVGYMVAHLISPQETDRRFGGDVAKFQRLTVKATPEKSAQLVKALGVHLEDGIWTIWRDQAWSHTDGTLGLSLQSIGKRWFMHNTPKNMPGQRVATLPDANTR
jgi:hypothetical protein